MATNQAKLISGRRLARNVFWNLLGSGAPLIAAIIAIPILISGLGTARFGVLTLAWMVVGYFSLFDLGLGRALTKLIAEKLGIGRNDEIPELVWTAMSLMTVLGMVGAITFATLTPWLITDVLKIPFEIQSESLIAFYLLAVSIPIVISTTGLRGILEAHQCFGLINAVRIPLGIFSFLGPAIVLSFSKSLVPVIVVLVIVRLVSWCSYAILSLKVEPVIRHRISINRKMIRQLINYGGWMTVTNIVGPLMVYMDRFLIGIVVSITAVAYYATPYEVVTKLWIIPGAIMGVLFPAFATSFVQDSQYAARLFGRSVNYIFLILFPVVLILVTLANDILGLWLGEEFASNGTLVMQLLAVGVFINCHAFVPLGLVQGAGRPELTAKLHLFELPFYLMFLWWMLGDYGIVGAAIAWVVRVVFDTLILFFMAQRVLSVVSSYTLRSLFISTMAILSLALGTFITGIVMKVCYLILMLVIFALFAWFFILVPDERNLVRSRLQMFFNSD